jgi:hypothetical protein
MGLKMLYENMAHKDIKYSRLKAFNILLPLRFEGVGPTQKNPQTADF